MSLGSLDMSGVMVYVSYIMVRVLVCMCNQLEQSVAELPRVCMYVHAKMSSYRCDTSSSVAMNTRCSRIR